MTDVELADKVLERVGRVLPGGVVNIYLRDHSPESFVRDWRVAGALLEKCARVEVQRSQPNKKWHVRADTYGPAEVVRGESLPRAIIEACVTALEAQ